MQRRPLKPFLDRLLTEIDWTDHRADDPVDLVWEYDRPADREIAAIVASSLAYGRADKIQEAARSVLSPLNPRPASRLRELSTEDLTEVYDTFRYRMTGPLALIDFLTAVRSALLDCGSLENLYATSDGVGHLEKAADFVDKLRARRSRQKLERGFRYLLPNPRDGSACKRLHLFFRWMGRPPGPIDPGTWTKLRPDEVMLPLDTHTSRICRYIGLVTRKSVDAKAVQRATSRLKEFDSADPIKYDFALCHLGISEQCQHEFSPDHCPQCPIEPICSIAHHSRSNET